MNQKLLRANWNELRFRAVMVCCWDTHFVWVMIKQLSAMPLQSYCSALSEQPKLQRETMVQCRMHVVRHWLYFFLWVVFKLQTDLNVRLERERYTEIDTEINVGDFSRRILDAHLSRPWALTHNDLLLCSYFWWIVIHIQHLDGNRNVTKEAGIVCSREREREWQRRWKSNASLNNKVEHQHCKLKLGHTVLFLLGCLWVLS